MTPITIQQIRENIEFIKDEDFDKQILFMYMAKFCFSIYTKYIKKQDFTQLNLFKKAYNKTKQFTELI